MTLSLSEIQTAANGLYRDPDPAFTRGVLRDALSELGKNWEGWMEESGTLMRLAECMVLTLLRGPWPMPTGVDTNLHAEWRRAVNTHPEALEPDGKLYAALCSAFGVPAVQIEVREVEYDGRNAGWNNPGRMVERWSPPSIPLAAATLRAFLAMQEQGLDVAAYLKDTRGRRPFWQGEGHKAVMANHPNATAYRLRLADGD